MDINVFKTILKKTSTVVPNIYVGFQGRWPLLIGVDFYKKNQISKEYSSSISFFIQTIGTLITQELCQLFKENNFIVGVSLDADKKMKENF